MSVDLVLRCDGCPTVEGNLPQQTAEEARALAIDSGWERRSIVTADGSIVELDLCQDCRDRPDDELVTVYENEPF